MKIILKILKYIGIILLVIFVLCIFLIFIESKNSEDSYKGGINPITGDWCDYGYNLDDNQCCQDDDYSCKTRDRDIYEDIDCKDFSSQKEAQRFFEESIKKYGSDYHRLDGNKDGVACENLK